MGDKPEVTQADRDMAAVVYSHFRDHDMAGWCRGGKADADWIVQAFARASQSESDAVRELVEALEKIAAEQHVPGCEFEYAPAHECPKCDRPAKIARAALARYQGEES